MLIEVEQFPQIFENYSNLRFHKISPVGAEFFHVPGRTGGRTDGRTVRHDEANNRSSQSC